MTKGFLSSTQVCEAAGITYRQLDWWIRKNTIPIVDEMVVSGSGDYRLIPDWYVPRLALLGRMQEAFQGSRRGGAKIGGSVLRRVFDEYDIGYVDLGGFSIAWAVQT